MERRYPLGFGALIALSALAATPVAAGCESIVGIQDRSVGLDLDATTTPDTGTDGGSDADANEDASSCTHAVPPARPAADDPDASASLTLELAVRSVDVGTRFDAGPRPVLGYDLDGVCTCPEARSCVPMPATSKSCDEPGGRDDAIGDLFQTFVDVSSGAFDATQFSTFMEVGVYGFVFRIKGYNGAANDTDIQFGYFLSNGTATSVDAGADAGSPMPKWDGSDFWTLDTASTLPPLAGVNATPIYFDTHAYVADHVLVAHFDYPVRLYGGVLGRITTDLGGAYLTGRLVPDGSSFRIVDGVMAGRFAVKDMPKGLAEFPDMTGGWTCKGTDTYNQLKPAICRAADIVADPAVTNPAAMCDALSLAFGFTAQPAKMGPTRDRPVSNSPCFANPGTESCP